MPVGVEVTVEDGVATVVFTDPSMRLRGVGDLLHASGGNPNDVEKITHPRTAYVVPEHVARAAGLIEDLPIKPARPAPIDLAPLEPPPAASGAHGYDDGKPDMDWHRDAMDTYASGLGLDTKALRNKHDVLEAIRSVEA